ncbi:2767_t:CDS:2, partial [Racocetra persica]
MMKSILETTKQVLMQNISIIEKQIALEGMITQLARDIKTLQTLHENFKSNMRDRGHEWWQKGATQELETLCPDKMVWYRSNSKWEALFTKIENSISTESCKYCESSESEITAWKESEEVQWCLKNLDNMIEEEDKMYLQIVAKKVFGRQPSLNQYAVTQAILHNLFDPELVKIKFDEKYLTRKLNIFLFNGAIL